MYPEELPWDEEYVCCAMEAPGNVTMAALDPVAMEAPCAVAMVAPGPMAMEAPGPADDR